MTRPIRKGDVSIVLGMAVLLSASAWAAPENGWNLQLQPMYMAAYGDGIDTGEEIREDWSGAPGFAYTSRSDKDIDVDYGGEPGIRGELQWTRKPWGLGVSGWYFSPDGSETREPRSTHNRAFSADPNRGVTESWFIPVFKRPGVSDGVFEDTTRTAIKYRVELDLELWSVDFYGVRTLTEKPNRHLNLLFGVKLLNAEEERKDRVSEVSPSIVDPATFEDVNQLKHISEADTEVMFGPMIGLQGYWSRRRHRLEGVLTQSWVFGDVDYSALISRRCDRRARGSDDSVSCGEALLATFEDTDNENMPVTEAKLAYLYDLTDNFSLGLGAFASVLWDAKRAPGFSGKEDDVIRFVGGMAVLEYRIQ